MLREDIRFFKNILQTSLEFVVINYISYFLTLAILYLNNKSFYFRLDKQLVYFFMVLLVSIFLPIKLISEDRKSQWCGIAIIRLLSYILFVDRRINSWLIWF